MDETSGEAVFLLWVSRGALAIEGLAVAVILGFMVVATLAWLRNMVTQRGMDVASYDQYRRRLGRSLLLGLEILVAADIVRTVALEATLENLLGLGLLVVIRTLLSWSIVLEIEGRWPWQPEPVDRTDERI